MIFFLQPLLYVPVSIQQFIQLQRLSISMSVIKGKNTNNFNFVLFFELTSLIRKQRNPSINSVFSCKSLQALGGGTQRIFKRIFDMVFDIRTNNSTTFFDIRTNHSATRWIFKLIKFLYNVGSIHSDPKMIMMTSTTGLYPSLNPPQVFSGQATSFLYPS